MVLLSRLTHDVGCLDNVRHATSLKWGTSRLKDLTFQEQIVYMGKNSPNFAEISPQSKSDLSKMGLFFSMQTIFAGIPPSFFSLCYFYYSVKNYNWSYKIKQCRCLIVIQSRNINNNSNNEININTQKYSLRLTGLKMILLSQDMSVM